MRPAASAWKEAAPQRDVERRRHRPCKRFQPAGGSRPAAERPRRNRGSSCKRSRRSGNGLVPRRISGLTTANAGSAQCCECLVVIGAEAERLRHCESPGSGRARARPGRAKRRRKIHRDDDLRKSAGRAARPDRRAIGRRARLDRGSPPRRKRVGRGSGPRVRDRQEPSTWAPLAGDRRGESRGSVYVATSASTLRKECKATRAPASPGAWRRSTGWPCSAGFFARTARPLLLGAAIRS